MSPRLEDRQSDGIGFAAETFQQTCPDQWVQGHVVRGDKKRPGSRNPALPQHELALLPTLVPRRQ
jgi:hypothetical protein